MRRESGNSQHLGLSPSKPFQHQPPASSNRWQEAEDRRVAVTSIPAQRCRGPQPLSCPSNHGLVLGCAELCQNPEHLQPTQRATSKPQQQAPKSSITPSSSSQTRLGAGRAPASVFIHCLGAKCGQQEGDTPKLHRGHMCHHWQQTRPPAPARPALWLQCQEQRTGQVGPGDAFPAEMLGGEKAPGNFLHQSPPACAQHEAEPRQHDHPQGPPGSGVC